MMKTQAESRNGIHQAGLFVDPIHARTSDTADIIDVDVTRTCRSGIGGSDYIEWLLLRCTMLTQLRACFQRVVGALSLGFKDVDTKRDSVCVL